MRLTQVDPSPAPRANCYGAYLGLSEASVGSPMYARTLATPTRYRPLQKFTRFCPLCGMNLPKPPRACSSLSEHKHFMLLQATRASKRGAGLYSLVLWCPVERC